MTSFQGFRRTLPGRQFPAIILGLSLLVAGTAIAQGPLPSKSSATAQGPINPPALPANPIAPPTGVFGPALNFPGGIPDFPGSQSHHLDCARSGVALGRRQRQRPHDRNCRRSDQFDQYLHRGSGRRRLAEHRRRCHLHSADGFSIDSLHGRPGHRAVEPSGPLCRHRRVQYLAGFELRLRDSRLLQWRRVVDPVHRSQRYIYLQASHRFEDLRSSHQPRHRLCSHGRLRRERAMLLEYRHL